MTKMLLVIGIVFLLLLVVEYLWRVKHYHSEFTRKFIHISVGTFAAFWPFFLTWGQIELLALAFLIVIAISRLLTIFGSIHIIGRRTFGEILFATSIGVTALISHNDLIFMAAMLHLSIADGLAAIIGTTYGKKNRYVVFGQLKSVTGTLVFWACSVLILIAYFTFSHAAYAVPVVLLLPILATMLENVGIRGTDNLIVPVVVAFVLRLI